VEAGGDRFEHDMDVMLKFKDLCKTTPHCEVVKKNWADALPSPSAQAPPPSAVLPETGQRPGSPVCRRGATTPVWGSRLAEGVRRWVAAAMEGGWAGCPTTARALDAQFQAVWAVVHRAVEVGMAAAGTAAHHP